MAIAVGAWQRTAGPDPCLSMGVRLEGSALAELAYRHDLQRSAISASNDMVLATTLAATQLAQHADAIERSAAARAAELTAAADRQRAELTAACRLARHVP